MMPKRVWKKNIDGMREVISKGRSSVFGKVVEGDMKRKDGREFVVETSRTMRKTDKGVFITAIIRDITERKQMEEALQAEREFTRELLRKLKGNHPGPGPGPRPCDCM